MNGNYTDGNGHSLQELNEMYKANEGIKELKGSRIIKDSDTVIKK